MKCFVLLLLSIVAVAIGLATYVPAVKQQGPMDIARDLAPVKYSLKYQRMSALISVAPMMLHSEGPHHLRKAVR